MKTLTKNQIELKDQIVERLKFEHVSLQGALEAYNRSIGQAWEALEARIDAFNLAAEAFNDYAEEIHTTQEEYYESRTDAWREAELGEEYLEWMSAWDYGVDQVDIEPPEDVDDLEPLELGMLTNFPAC